MKRKALLFAGVCAMHGVLGWFLVTASRVMKLHAEGRSLELLMFPPTQAPPPAPPRVEQQSGAPRDVNFSKHSRIVDRKNTAESSTQSETTPPVDWNAELARVARAAAGADAKAPLRNFGFPARSPTTKDYPQFDWDYARTHRVESLPEGGTVIHLNDNCVIVLTPFPFPFCSPFKRKANGELFKHMRDPDKPADAGLP